MVLSSGKLMTDTKNSIRKKLFEKRMELSSSDVQNYSNEIVNKLVNHIDWHEIKKINIYQPIRLNREVDISGLDDFIRREYPQIRIDVTKSKISESHNIPSGNDYDLVIVPLIGFDRSGNRLGYGGGYYDRFLAGNNCKQTIGVAYSIQEVLALPTEPHDKKLDLVITEKEVIRT